MNKFTQPGKMKQVNATILAPELAGLRLILNVCGQNGKFDSKLDNLLAKRWTKTRESYKEWYATQHNFKLGMLNTTAVGSDTWVVNMLVKDKDDKIDPTALKTAVKKLGELCKYEKASAHISSLVIEEVPELKELLVKGLVEEGINVFTYMEPTK
jgi:hypothetical protein